MTADQHELVADVLNGFQPIGDVPESFADFVAERIAARPSPAPSPVDVFAEIKAMLAESDAKIDAILALLQGGTPE